MTIIRSIIMAFSCFSAVPMPQVTWSTHNMRYMMAAFPLVGALIGILLIAWGHACVALGLGPLPLGAGLTLLPIVISGGIHMDGFADVMDAQSSHAEPACRREILHDPHVGAFAIIGVCCYLIAHLALASEVGTQQLVALACAPVISRCLSGYATVTFKAARKDGMYASEGATDCANVVRIVLALLGAAAFTLMASQGLAAALAAIASAVAALVATKRLADSSYGGMNGDLAGFYLQVAELAMLACLVIVGRLV